VFTNAYTLRNTTYAGLNFSSLAYSRPENATSGKVRGVELNYQQQLTMLPSPFDGIGFAVNYHLADSDERLFTGRRNPCDSRNRPTRSTTLRYSMKNTVSRPRRLYFTGDFIKAFGSDSTATNIRRSAKSSTPRSVTESTSTSRSSPT
jgi:hypothetical protein